MSKVKTRLVKPNKLQKGKSFGYQIREGRASNYHCFRVDRPGNGVQKLLALLKMVVQFINLSHLTKQFKNLTQPINHHTTKKTISISISAKIQKHKPAHRNADPESHSQSHHLNSPPTTQTHQTIKNTYTKIGMSPI